MNIFKAQENEKLISLLASAKQDFKFNQADIKTRLLAQLPHAKQPAAKQFRFSSPLIFRSGFFFAGVILLVSGTFVAASQSQPGDKLFGINKLRQEMLVRLPLGAEGKAKAHAHLVEERLKSLDRLPEQAAQVKLRQENRKLEVIKETERSLNQAVNTIRKNQEALEKKGNKEAASRLQDVLTTIGDMAEKREQTIKRIEEESKNDTKRELLEGHLKDLKEARQKAIDEGKRWERTGN